MSTKPSDNTDNAAQGVLRGDVIRVEMDGARGVEKYGERPAVVVQANYLNERLESAVVVPATKRSGGGRMVEREHDVVVPEGEGGLDGTSFIECNQARTLDLTERRVRDVGWLPPHRMEEVDEALRNALGL